MPATLRHFAINADNVQRAKAFYEKVFGWTFSPWGPPDFYQVRNAGTGLIGALQERRDLQAARPTNAFETSFAVDDIQTTEILSRIGQELWVSGCDRGLRIDNRGYQSQRFGNALVCCASRA